MIEMLDYAVNRDVIVPGELSFGISVADTTENVVSQGPNEIDCQSVAFDADNMTAIVTIKADIAGNSIGTGGTLSAHAALVYRVDAGSWFGLPSYSVMTRSSNSTVYQSSEINAIKIDLPDGEIEFALSLGCINGSDLSQQAKFDNMSIDALITFRK